MSMLVTHRRSLSGDGRVEYKCKDNNQWYFTIYPGEDLNHLYNLKHSKNFTDSCIDYLGLLALSSKQFHTKQKCAAVASNLFFKVGLPSLDTKIIVLNSYSIESFNNIKNLDAIVFFKRDGSWTIRMVTSKNKETSDLWYKEMRGLAFKTRLEALTAFKQWLIHHNIQTI